MNPNVTNYIQMPATPLPFSAGPAAAPASPFATGPAPQAEQPAQRPNPLHALGDFKNSLQNASPVVKWATAGAIILSAFGSTMYGMRRLLIDGIVGAAAGAVVGFLLGGNKQN